MSSEQEEGVLRDILEELDRERSKRAELEQQIRKLTIEATEARSLAAVATAAQQQQEKQIQENKESVTRKAFVAMEAQVEGYQQLVDALTCGKPAIAAAAAAASASSLGSRRNQQKDRRKSLPLHVVRLLEVLPWDPRTREHIFGIEEIFEWQFYDNREQKWQSNVRHFPAAFRSLPIVKPKPGGDNMIEEDGGAQNNKDRNLLLFLAGGDLGAAAPANHGVLTNERLTRLFNIESGYPLPEDGGGWQWVGGWRIAKLLSMETSEGNVKQQKVDCDENGWSYAVEAQHFTLNPTEWVWDNPGDESIAGSGSKKRSEIKRKLRRRKWTRQRVLVDYPHASERSQKYLQLLAENARLSVTANKISDQLVATKTALTKSEEKMMQTMESNLRLIKGLQEELQKKTELLKTVGLSENVNLPRSAEGEEDAAGNPVQEFLAKNEQVKDIGSKISQFDWKNLAPVALRDKMKQQQNSSNGVQRPDEATSGRSTEDQVASEQENQANIESDKPAVSS